MEINLDRRLIARWKTAATKLGIEVVAPVELQDAAGIAFSCEVFLPDFGSDNGALIVSPKTERRIRPQLRSLSDTIFIVHESGSAYKQTHVVEELMDFGWFGKPGEEPDWYIMRRG